MNVADAAIIGGQDTGVLPSATRRPVDLTHLSRQTMGDRDLEREVLGLFIRDAAETLASISAAKADGVRMLAHRLKGSSRAIGAFNLARFAEAIEQSPSKAAVAAAKRELAQIEDFLASVQR